MHQHLDRFAKDLAEGLSRRSALGRLGGSVFGGLAASLGLGRLAWGQSCREACKQQCTSADGKLDFVCFRACANSDSNNCGACGNKCAAGTQCVNGVCVDTSNCANDALTIASLAAARSAVQAGATDA